MKFRQMRDKILNEKVYIEKLILSDEGAFSFLFTSYYSDLLFYAWRIIKNKVDAEEIVQDVFVNLWESRGTLNIETSLKSYLIKCIHNKCLDWHRHQKVRNKYALDMKLKIPSIVDYNDHYLLKSEMDGLIRKAFAGLPPEIPEAWRMSRDEGLKYYEIAEKLNVSARTIEVRISKALIVLRKHLQEYFLIFALGFCLWC